MWKITLCFVGLAGFAQTGISGFANIQLLDGGTTCDGNTRVIQVWADIQGLNGLGGLAGLNSFVLSLSIDQADLFASGQPGPVMASQPWQVRTTAKDLVVSRHELVIVGWVAASNAPNANIHLTDIFLSGTAGPVSLQLLPNQSSLGSRVVAGDGPGPIGIDPNTPPLTVQVPQWNLMREEAFLAWLSNDANYDIHPTDGRVDIRDLVLFESCNPN